MIEKTITTLVVLLGIAMILFAITVEIVGTEEVGTFIYEVIN